MFVRDTFGLGICVARGIIADGLTMSIIKGTCKYYILLYIRPHKHFVAN